MNAMSSTCFATFGYFSQTHAPDWPYCLNLNGDFISGPGLPLKTSIAICLPSLLSSSGLGSNRSTALGRAFHEQPDHRLGLGGKVRRWKAARFVGRRVIGQERLAAQQVRQGEHAQAAAGPREEIAAVANRRHAAAGKQASRVHRRTSVDIEELVQAEQGLAEVGHGCGANFGGRLAGVAGLSPIGLGFQELERGRSFARGRRAGQGQLEGAIRQAGFVASFAEQPAGEVDGAGADERVVQQRQGLRGDGRLVAAAAACWASGRSNACNSGYGTTRLWNM